MEPPRPRATWQQELEEAAARAEQDLRGVIAYINDAVVPELRRNGVQALKSAAVELHRLATKLDERAGGARPGTGSGTGPGTGSEERRP